MKEIIFIGTVHGGMTNHEELSEVLNSISPDAVLIELSPEELANRRDTSIRDEMFFVYDWAIKNKIPVDVFDVENDILREGCTGKEAKLIEYNNVMKKLLQGYSWKDLNKREPWETPELKEIENKINEEYVDPVKMSKRDEVMLKNILEKAIDGRNVIITGVSHLSFFKERMPNAKLLLRD